MKERIANGFKQIYSGEPRIFQAPGRINLIGEHTDYNGGFVFPMAIDRFTYIAIKKRGDRMFNVYSKNFKQSFSLDLDKFVKNNTWSDYVFGVASMIEKEGYGLSGSDIYIESDVPLGAGLSSSAAIEVSTAFALFSVNEIIIDKNYLAKLCQKAENEFVGMKCGIMDQFIACFGKKDHALFLDCRSLNYNLVPLNTDVAQIIVCNTMVKHELGASEYNIRRKECEEGVKILKEKFPDIISLRDANMTKLESIEAKMSDKVRMRCRHVISENLRAENSVKALMAGDLVYFGKLLDASHYSLKYDYEVTCEELDMMVEIARNIDGVYGARMTGGGFGGCTINLVKLENISTFINKIKSEYLKHTSINPDIYSFLPSNGVCEI